MENKFGERLKELLKENNMKNRDLAEKLNISSRLVYYWTNGQRECGFDMLLELSGIFDVTTDFLLGKTDF